jgi:hypothetical protein
MTTRKARPKDKHLHTLIARKKPQVFQSTSAKKRFKMPVSDSLPDMKFRIGGKESKFSIAVVVNTCAAMTLAYKTYHTKIYKSYPHLVAQYTNFRKEGFQTFGIGGIDKEEQGIIVKAAMTYYTPFFHNGKQVKIQFTLSKSLTTNTILGFPSIVQMKLAMLLHKGYIHSEVFNMQFSITMQVPSRSSTPPNVTGAITPTTLLNQASKNPILMQTDQRDPSE